MINNHRTVRIRLLIRTTNRYHSKQSLETMSNTMINYRRVKQQMKLSARNQKRNVTIVYNYTNFPIILDTNQSESSQIFTYTIIYVLVICILHFIYHYLLSIIYRSDLLSSILFHINTSQNTDRISEYYRNYANTLTLCMISVVMIILLIAVTHRLRNNLKWSDLNIRNNKQFEDCSTMIMWLLDRHCWQLSVISITCFATIEVYSTIRLIAFILEYLDVLFAIDRRHSYDR